jgi:hypothetical protein
MPKAFAVIGGSRSRALLALTFLCAALTGAVSPSSAQEVQTRVEKANLWIDPTGGTCTRSAAASAYRDSAACQSLDQAWDACRPGDTIGLERGVYGEQTVTGNKSAPGCTVRGEDGATISDLVTAGTYFKLANVTVDAGTAKHAGWKTTASHVTLTNVRLHGPFVRVEISNVSDVSWIGGELGTAGTTGGKRVCGQDALPVEIGSAEHVTISGVRFHPQDADPTPSTCSSNGFHLEMIRLDGGTSFFTLRNSTFDSGDHSGTASVFITVPDPSGNAPHDLTFENNFFGTNESVGAFDIHANVTRCVNFTFAYNTFLKTPGLFQCTSFVNTRWIGNLGANGPSSPCLGISINNVWQDPSRDNCGSDKWVRGARGQTDRLGLGGADGFHLRAGSPAIDAGEASGFCTSTLRGRDRDGEPRQRGIRCDAGADEYDLGPTVVATLAHARLRRGRGGDLLMLKVHVGEPVTLDVRLVQGRRTLMHTTYASTRVGNSMTAVPVPQQVSADPASVRIAFKDVAGNRRVVEQRVRAG